MQVLAGTGIMPAHVSYPGHLEENAMKKTALLAALLGAATLTTPAFAQTASEGGFMGLSVMSSNSDLANDYSASIAGDADSKSTGFKIFGGYMWGNWGVELGLYQLGKWEARNSAGGQAAQFESQAVSLAGVYMAPFATNGVLHLKAGGAQISTEFNCTAPCVGGSTSEKTSTVFLAGVGVGWRLSPGVMLRADFDRFSSVKFSTGSAEGTSPIEVVAVGVHFTF